jgi:hypothetical protein
MVGPHKRDKGLPAPRCTHRLVYDDDSERSEEDASVTAAVRRDAKYTCPAALSDVVTVGPNLTKAMEVDPACRDGTHTDTARSDQRSASSVAPGRAPSAHTWATELDTRVTGVPAAGLATTLLATVSQPFSKRWGATKRL